MKKIIGIIAAVAMVASVFAADVAATVHLGGTLLGINNGDVSALSIENKANAPWDTAFGFNASDEKSGASFNLWFTNVTYKEDGTNADFLQSGNWKIWLKPIDMLKITVGDQSYNLHQESITWGGSKSGSDGGAGYGLEIAPADGVAITAALLPGWKGLWLNGSVVSNTYIKVQVSNFSAMVRTKSGKNTKGEDAFNDFVFGVGYDTKLGDVDFWINALAWLNENGVNKDGKTVMGIEKLRVETFFAGNAGSVGWKLFAPIDIYTNKYANVSYYKDGGAASRVAFDKLSKDAQDKTDADNNPKKYRKFAEFAPIAYAQVGVSSLTLSVTAKLCDIIGVVANGNDFWLQLEPTIAGNVGMCAWDIGCTLRLEDGLKTDITFPVNFKVSF